MRVQTSPLLSGGDQFLEAYCFSTDAVGDAVYIMGNKVGDRYQVTKVNIDDVSTVPAIGLITYKSSPTDCEVQIAGIVRGIYSGLTAQKLLFVGTDGTLTHNVVPRPMAGRRAHLVMGHAIDSSELLLRIESPIMIVPY